MVVNVDGISHGGNCLRISQVLGKSLWEKPVVETLETGTGDDDDDDDNFELVYVSGGTNLSQDEVDKLIANEKRETSEMVEKYQKKLEFYGVSRLCSVQLSSNAGLQM